MISTYGCVTQIVCPFLAVREPRLISYSPGLGINTIAWEDDADRDILAAIVKADCR